MVPQYQWPESSPVACLRSPQNRMTENPNRTCGGDVRAEEGRAGNGAAHHTVIERVEDPEPKRGLCEESVLLPEHVQLRIAVEDARRDELVKDADDEWREDGEDDVVQGQGPRLVRDLARKVVEERELRRGRQTRTGRTGGDEPRTGSCTARCSCRTSLREGREPRAHACGARHAQRMSLDRRW